MRIPVESGESSWDEFMAREAGDELIDARAQRASRQLT